MANFTKEEITNALNKFKWSQDAGQKMTVTYSFGDNTIMTSYWESWPVDIRKLLFILICIFFCQNCLAGEIQNPVIFEIKDGFYNRFDGFKWVENHTIKIYQDGKVHYHENKKVELTKPNSVPVNHYAQLTKDQLDELIVGFLSLPFKELPKYEEKRSSDIFFHLTISLKLYYVEMYVDNVLLHKAFLTKLKKYISKDLSTWLCNPTEHDKDFIKSCERQNFLPDNFKF